MSIKPRTIDNLGVETSVRYANDKEQLDVRLIDDSKWLPRSLEISVTKPYVPSEFDQLFSSERLTQWALFAAPPNYGLQNRTLFSYQLIPSLGTYEKQEADTEKLAALKDVLSKRRRQKGQDQSGQQHQDEQEEEKEEGERQILLELFKCIEKIDRSLSFINARRNQYQRG
jgi:hypothetical protein